MIGAPFCLSGSSPHQKRSMQGDSTARRPLPTPPFLQPLGVVCRAAPAKRHGTETDRSCARPSVASPFEEFAPWIMLAPATVIVLTTLSISLLGDWLRDKLDPTLR